MRPILECQRLTKKYGSFFALSNVTFSLERGQIVGLLGPNGSGKTTLIKLANGLLNPTDGHIMINGLAPGTATKKIVSYLPDRSFFNEYMRVKDMLAYYADFYRNFSMERAAKMLDTLEIDRSKRLSALSKGAKEKVQLVLVMSRDADLYILDEPIGGVDPAARDYILQTILTNYSDNATVLISTHLISDIENVLDRVLFLQNGQLTLNATADEIRTQYGKSVDALFREVFKC
ncbi:MAG TPA: ABC transporter ATP-binding protein [Candidatus Mediterraneibacter pullistercoris]|nr:ABC transporter ATP-binding protein [Candidatus Mediterraneibacter pullistercoris]